MVMMVMMIIVVIFSSSSVMTAASRNTVPSSALNLNFSVVESEAWQIQKSNRKTEDLENCRDH